MINSAPQPAVSRYDAVVCGAGIAGIAAAHALTQAGVARIALIDMGPPLALTSDKSTECYRNWWPGPGDAMVALMNRSIDLMEAHADRSDNRFLMSRRGYVFATARQEMAETFTRQAEEAADLGAGPLRVIKNASDYRPAAAEGFRDGRDGADLITDRALIREHFAYLNADTVAVLHARRCGALSAQQLGMYVLEEARANGVDLIAGEVTAIERAAGRVAGIELATDTGPRCIATDTVVLAPGPHLGAVLALANATLPVVVEKHIKISVADSLGVVPRTAPLIIWCDPTPLKWTEDERAALAEDEATRYLLEPLPAGVHGRPVGAGDQVLMYWTYDCEERAAPEFPLDWDPFLPDITLRGMAVLVPGLEAYFDPMPKPYVDGGYYTKTPDNRPLIGPLGLSGAYVCSAFSGYGIMASLAAGELLAAHVAGKELPHYAGAFDPGRWADAAYLAEVATWDASGQL